MVMLVLAVMLAQDPALSGDRSLVSKCDVSADAEYGYTKLKPIKVGGSPMYGPRRQRQFLQALVGPAGQPITFKRRGSIAPVEGQIILDLYEVTYAGVEKPIELYLDLYRWEGVPKAPQGFLCGAPIGLAPPPPDPFEARKQLIDAAMNWAGGEIAPIPLEPGSSARGMGFDPFRLIVLAARDAAANGRPFTAADAMRVPTPTVLIVANPVECEGKQTAPDAIAFVNAQGRTLKPMGPLMKGEDLQKILPGVALAAGAAGARFGGNWPLGGFVSIEYAGDACGDPVRLSVRGGAPEKIVDVRPDWPRGMPIPPAGEQVEVRIRARIGLDGVPTDLEPLSPVSPFMVPAVAAVREWRYKPMVINGEPSFVPITMTVTVTFGRK